MSIENQDVFTLHWGWLDPTAQLGEGAMSTSEEVKRLFFQCNLENSTEGRCNRIGDGKKWRDLVVILDGDFNDTLWLFNVAIENGPFIDGLPWFTY